MSDHSFLGTAGATAGPAELLAFVPLGVMLVCAAVVDCRQRRIPNVVTFAMLLSGFLQSFLPGHTLTPGQSAYGFVLGFLPPLALFLIRIRGAGDVKLQAGIGAWVGPVTVLWVFVIASLVAGLLALYQSIRKGRLVALLRDSAMVAANAACFGKIGLSEADEIAAANGGAGPGGVKDRYLPYAVPLLIATVVVLLMRFCLPARN